VAAMALELRPLGQTIPRGRSLASLADGTLLTISGVGRAAAAAGARRLVEAGARALVSWGMAGALDATLAAGTLMLPREVVTPEGETLLTARDWREHLRGAITATSISFPVCDGRLLTCREPLASAADKATALRHSGAAAVDLESFAVAEIAAGSRLPFLVVRAIVDTAADALPPMLIAAVDDAGHASTGRLLGALARAPGELPALIRLISRYRAARRALAMVARSGALTVPPASRDFDAAGRA